MTTHLTVEQVAHERGVPEDAIHQAIIDGDLPILIDTEDLDRWLDSCVRGVTPTPHGPLTFRTIGAYVQWELPVGLNAQQQHELAALLTGGDVTDDDSWPRLPKSWTVTDPTDPT